MKKKYIVPYLCGLALTLMVIGLGSIFYNALIQDEGLSIVSNILYTFVLYSSYAVVFRIYNKGNKITKKEGTIYVISATVITFILWDILVPLFIAGYPFSNTTPAIVFGIIAYWIIPTQNSNVDDSKAVDSNTKEENSNE